MDKDFEVYIRLIGIHQVQNNLKESLSKATINEDWKLIYDITNFIENEIKTNKNITYNHFNNYNLSKDLEYSTAKNVKSSNFINHNIWKKLKYLIVEILEIDTELLVPETVIFTAYRPHQKVTINNTNNYSNVNYKHKDHWLVGIAQGISEIACTRFGDSTGEKYEGYSDIGCDNLDFTELMMSVEDEFAIEISDEIAKKIETVQDLYDVIISFLEQS